MTIWVVIFSMMVAAYFTGSGERKEAGPAPAPASARPAPANRAAVEDSQRVTAPAVPSGKTENRAGSSDEG